MAESKIYISGKISALPINEAINNFNNAEEYLKQKYFYIGAQIVNPFKLDHSKAEELKRRQLDPAVPDNEKPTEHEVWAAYMEVDCGALLTCDGIYMLKNWAESKGARIEYVIAQELGLTIEYER